jgi:uncharacterized membrane protein YccC
MSSVNPPLIGLSEHPRAAYAIRRAKAGAGLVGFLIAGIGSWFAGVPVADAAMRGLAGSVAGCLVGWFAAIAVWRSLLQAEARVAVERAVEHRRREHRAGDAV